MAKRFSGDENPSKRLDWSQWKKNKQVEFRAGAADEDGPTDAELVELAAGGDPAAAPKAHLLLGIRQRDVGDPVAAEASFRSALHSPDPQVWAEVRFQLGMLLWDRGEAKEAGVVWSELAESEDPEYVAKANIGLSAILADRGDLAGAVALSVRVARSGASTGAIETALVNLVQAAKRQLAGGDRDGAARALRQLAGVHVGADPVNLTVESVGEATDADVLRTAAALVGAGLPDRAEILLGDILAEQGAIAAARTAYERVRDGQDAKLSRIAAYKLVTMLGDQGEAAAARPALEQLASEDDDIVGPLMRLQLAMVQTESGEHEHALDSLRSAAGSDDPRVSVLANYLLGQTLREQGEMAGARAAYQQVAASDDPKYGPNALLNLGVMAFEEDDSQTARQCWLRAAAGDDDEARAGAENNLGMLAKDARDLPEAEHWYGRAIASGDPERAALAAAHLGELCYWLADWPATVRWYQQTLSGTNDPELVGEAAYRTAEIVARDGDAAAALPLLRRAASTGDETFAPLATALFERLTNTAETGSQS